MDDDQQFCLRWNNHQSTLISVFDTLLENETLVDCTLAAEGKFLKAHKVVLSACSPYFATLLQEQYDKHPIFILKDVKYQELRAMMDYMYRGEVNISQDQLAALLKAAESLQIKGLSDNRTSGNSNTSKQDHHRGLNAGGAGISGGGIKLSGSYTLEQTKRARMGPSSMESQDMSASREGSSSPSRRRRKVRRRSIETGDNSNSSQIQVNQPSLIQQQQSNANLVGVSAITAAASALASQIPASAAPLSAGVPAASASAAATISSTQGTTQQQLLTTSVTKKTESAKATTSDAMNTEKLQAGGADEHDMEQIKSEKQNHKQKTTGVAKETTEMVIEPKSEYDDDGNDETVEDLTLDEEEMGMDDLDHNAGTSQGGEGSSQGYAAWQHDRSQDDILLATQEAQQRDPQDLTQKITQNLKENTAPTTMLQIHKTNPRSILLTKKFKRTYIRNQTGVDSTIKNTQNEILIGNPRKRLSVSDVTEQLFEYFNNNSAKAPKTQQQPLNKQTSPASAETAEPSTKAAIATNSAIIKLTNTASKNLQGDEMVKQANKVEEHISTSSTAASFHPRIKYTLKQTINNHSDDENDDDVEQMPTYPEAVLSKSPQVDVKPLIDPVTGFVVNTNHTTVITPNPLLVNRQAPDVGAAVPPAAALAAALMRNGFHTFQQHMRANEILKHQVGKPNKAVQKISFDSNESSQNTDDTVSAARILETLMRQQREQAHLRHHHESSGDGNAITTDDGKSDSGDGEDDSRFNGFEDICLVECNTRSNFSDTSLPSMYMGGTSAESQKLLLAAQRAQAHPLSYSFGDNLEDHPDGEPLYECRHCGKKYRWKSTLRRHENVECGGKEPSHQCPYCPYKSKQRGNLGVHVRKHHANLPQLASRRRSKYSTRVEPGNINAMNFSDESEGKLVIDCSK